MTHLLNKYTDLELIRWAGLFEGDGFFGIRQFKLALVDFDLVQRCTNSIGGTTRQPKVPEGYQPMLECCVGRKSGVTDLYQSLYPFLSEHRQKAVKAHFAHYKIPYQENFSIYGDYPLAEPGQHPVTPNRALSLQELAWLSGIFLAEGSIGYNKRSKVPIPYFTLSSTDKDVIQLVSFLSGQAYHMLKRRTVTNKLVYRVTVTRQGRLYYLFMNLLPWISICERKSQAMEQAIRVLESLKNMSADKKMIGKQQKAIQKLHTDSTHPRLTPAQYQRLGSIFQRKKTGIFFIADVKNRWKKPRLRVEDTDLKMIEEVAEMFQTKVETFKTLRRTGETLYRTQVEKRSIVFDLLRGIKPFVSGDCLAQVQIGLEYLDKYSLD